MKEIMTFEEYTGNNVRTPEAVKAYLDYLRENGKTNWLLKGVTK